MTRHFPHLQPVRPVYGELGVGDRKYKDKWIHTCLLFLRAVLYIYI